MEALPDAIIQYILSNVDDGKDVVACSSVSKHWEGLMHYIKKVYFPRNLFDNLSASWLLHSGPSLRIIELRLDNILERQPSNDTISKLDCIQEAFNLEILKLWGVLMVNPPKWGTFHRLKNLEIVGAKMEDPALSSALQACPNLISLALLGCEGLRYVAIDLPYLKTCKLDLYGSGNCSLSVSSPGIELLEVQGCSWIRVLNTQCLNSLYIANNSGKVYMVDLGKLETLETLSMRGVQWSWDAISKLLEMASEVKHLFMKVEFTGDFEALLPFPEIDFVDFFNTHPKLQSFDIHGAMFAALCQKNSLNNVDPKFDIPCLERAVITVRSPLNAEQKMNTLESFTKYATKLKKLSIRILQMKSSQRSADKFFEDIWRFKSINNRIVSIE